MISYAYHQVNNFWHRHRVDIAEASAQIAPSGYVSGPSHTKDQIQITTSNDKKSTTDPAGSARGRISSDASTHLGFDSDSDTEQPAPLLNNASPKKMPEVEALKLANEKLKTYSARFSDFNSRDGQTFLHYMKTIKQMVKHGETLDLLDLPNTKISVVVEFYKDNIAIYDDTMHEGREEFSSTRVPDIVGEKTAMFAHYYLDYLKSFVDKSEKSESYFIDKHRTKEITRTRALYKALEKNLNDYYAKKLDLDLASVKDDESATENNDDLGAENDSYYLSPPETTENYLYQEGQSTYYYYPPNTSSSALYNNTANNSYNNSDNFSSYGHNPNSPPPGFYNN